MSLITRVVGNVFHVAINRPHVRNAVNGVVAAELKRAFLDFDLDAALHVAVLSGEGGTFCAGADLRAVATGVDVNDTTQPGPMGPTALRLTKPVIAAIAGHAVAGGLELALWCDLRVVEADAVMGVLCRRVGVPLIDGGTVRLPRIVGHGRALDLILTGRQIGAAEALEFGLATRVVPTGKGVEAAMALAGQIAALPQMCLRSDRRSVMEQWDAPSEADALARELELGRATLAAGDAKSGAEKFVRGQGRHGSGM